MSVEKEDASLKDLVTKTLHASGVLGKIQAQLRASVFLALEEDFHKKNIPLVNKESSKLLSSSEGTLAASLVYDFLQHLKLEFTQSVFAPESGMTASWNLKDNSMLANDLNLHKTSDQNLPLLCQLIKNHLSLEKSENKSFDNNKKVMPHLSPNSIASLGMSPLPPLSPGGKASALPPIFSDVKSSLGESSVRSSSDSLSEKSSKINKDLSGNVFTIEKLSTKLDKEDSSEEKSSPKNLKQKLVNDLNKFEPTTDGSSLSSNEELLDSDKLATDTDKQYEDDFSSASERQGRDLDNVSESSHTLTNSNDKSNTEDSKDEIEEEIEEDISDILNSACSIESDNTKDLPVKDANVLITYQEEL